MDRAFEPGEIRMADQAEQYLGKQLGNYRLTQLLGWGGFAEIYLGEHVHLGTPAAIKVLKARLTEEEIDQFRNEARTIITIEHPHIVRVLDFGIEGQIPFIVMSYAPNGSLRKLYPAGTRLPLATVVSYVKQIADALQHVHEMRIVHRDIKPENMLLGRNNEVLLTDFGIATIAHSTSSLNMETGSGTLSYMSPEQIQGHPRPASDQYSLAVVVYEWLTGTRPFSGTAWEIVSQHLSAPPPPLRQHIPSISPEVERVVLTALAKDPHQRFESVRKFAEALEQAISKPAQGAALCTYRGHSDVIWSVAWSPDGTRIASAGTDRTAQVWEVQTGSPILTYSRHAHHILSVAWSPDSSRIVSADAEHIVRVWHTQTGQHALTYLGHTDQVWAAAWSPDGSLIASVGTDKTAQVWEAATGERLLIYSRHKGTVDALAWSPDGSSIASASDDKTVQVWQARTGATAFSYSGHSDEVWAVAWSPNGALIASAGRDKTVQVWQAQTGRPILTYHGHTNWIRSIAWCPTRAILASASYDGTVQVWEATTGKPIYTYRNHTREVLTLTWSPDGTRIASAGGDGTVQVWQVL